MSQPASVTPWYTEGKDPWILEQNQWDPDRNIYFETIMTQSNGYMGIRGYTEETNNGDKIEACREGYLAGIFGTVDEAAMEQLDVEYEWRMLCMVSLPELFACEVELDGEIFRLSEGVVESFRRHLDMRQGELVREVVWTSPRGKTSRLRFERFLSAAVVHLGMQRITLEAKNWEGKAALRFEADGAIPSYFRCGIRTHPHLPQALLENLKITSPHPGLSMITAETRGTGHTVAFASAVGSAGQVTEASISPLMIQQVDFSLKRGAEVSADHSIAVTTSRDPFQDSGAAPAAIEVAQTALQSGYRSCLEASEAIWKERWKMSDLEIDGPARDQIYARYGSFSMLQMGLFHTDHMSIPARAYAYNRYHGLYYWDSEAFLLPYYLHTHPAVAENLLKFRYRTLEGARRTAQHLKAPGVCFPWMTDSEDGTEQAPWGIGDYLWHQNADIAYAINQYVEATGDTEFMVTGGLEMIVESARFWISRLQEDSDGIFHLNDTVGPDELDNHGKDNGYTSLLARRHLRYAASWTEKLSAQMADRKWMPDDSEVAAWKNAAEMMAVPDVPGENFPLQDEFLLAKKPLKFDGLTADEAFAKRHAHRVVKQADVILAMYLLEEEFTTEQMRDAYDFYEPMTLHFSSLSYNTHSIVGNRIGRHDQAYDYFLKAAGLDLDNIRNATKDGLHAAALGGTWQTIVYGFLGMRLTERGLVLDPHLPEAWNSVSCRILYRGYRLKVRVTKSGHELEIEAADSTQPARVYCGSQVYELESKELAEASAG
jgi:trehalose/maltose hydrolase-like predicted phosphorylase